MIIGYTAGVYDLFHIGHLALLKNCKGLCDKLIVGVTVDELVAYKGKRALIPFEDRIEIVRSCKYVDAAVPQYDMDKLTMCKKLGASVLFVGDDWYGTDKWKEYEKSFDDAGIKIIYFPYTKGVSSTLINKTLLDARGKAKETAIMVDKDFCMSSYLAYRYIEKDGVEFKEGFHHENIKPVPENEKTLVKTADDIDVGIQKVFDGLKGKRLGVLLFGGMDSAICASYMRGQNAYTFRFLGGEFQREELERAEYYAKYYGLNLRYVDISWDTAKTYTKPCMESKCAPVHSIEPQLLQAALQAKAEGIEHLIVGESADLLFGGMDKLLAKDWTIEEFTERYTFTKPEDVLKNPVDVSYLFKRFSRQNGTFDFLDFMDNVFSIESSSSYLNAFKVAGMPYTDPYSKLKMADPLDLNRVRNGEPKYLIRELMAKKYPEIPVPNKNPMPRPVDFYFKDWKGPTRPEFKENLDMTKFTGNQKWQIWCLEEFLKQIENG